MSGKILSIGVMVSLGCSACAGPQITTLDVEMMQAQSEAISACYANEIGRRNASSYTDARDQALIIMAEALAGGGKDRCAAIAGMNAYESRARIAEAQNKAAIGVTSSIVTGGIAVSGIIAGADVLKSAIQNAGDQTTTTGDGNTHTSIETVANTENDLKTTGDNSPSVAENPAVTGPDMSNTETYNLE